MTLPKNIAVPDFYDQQWATAQGINDYNLFLIMFKSALQHSYSLLGNLSGKKLLEVGCGSGQQAVWFATQGARVTAIDVSDQSVQNTKQWAKQQRVKLTALTMNAEQLPFSENTFDLVYLNSVLMHVDPERVLQECARVLKKGGKIVIVEPLQSNPLLRLYRRWFSSYATMNPRYLTLRQFKRFHSQLQFSQMQHREFYGLALAALPFYHLFSDKRKAQLLSSPLEKVDAALLQLLPPLRSWCWVTVVGYGK